MGLGAGCLAADGRMGRAGTAQGEGAAAGLAEPSSSRSSFLLSSRQAVPGGQLQFESRLQKFQVLLLRTPGDSNSLEL